MKTTLTITNKDSEWSGLMKLPDEVVIKQLRRDLGSANAYIEELEDKLKLAKCNEQLHICEEKLREYKKKLKTANWHIACYRRIYGQIPSDNIEMDEK